MIEALDRANIDKAVIFGLPVSKLWAEYDREPPDYYLANDSPCYYYGYTDVTVAEMVRALPTEQQARLYPLMCGFNPVDRYAIRHVERLYAQYPDVWSGIGEMLLALGNLDAEHMTAMIMRLGKTPVVVNDSPGAGVLSCQ